MTDHETVQEIVQRLVAAANPEQIILFGSRARDEAHDDSDVDLLVIESEPFGPQRSRLREIGRLESAIGRLYIWEARLLKFTQRFFYDQLGNLEA